MHHIARYGSEATTRRLLDFARQHETKNLGLQVALFQADSSAARRNAARTRGAGSRLGRQSDRPSARLEARTERGSRHQAGRRLAADGSAEASGRIGRRTRRRRGSAQPLWTPWRASIRAATCRRPGRRPRRRRSTVRAARAERKLLAQANQPETQAELLNFLPTAPARLQMRIAAGLAAVATGAEKLLDTVKTGKASARLLQDPAVELRLASRTRPPRWKERIDELTAGLPPAGKDMQDLLNRRRDGFLKAKKDVALGAQVFAKNCANCHQVGGQGAKIGPQLDGVGVRGLDRLLEDILDPNRNVDQAFRLTTLNAQERASGVRPAAQRGGRGAGAGRRAGQGSARGRRTRSRNAARRKSRRCRANFAEQIPEADFNNLLAYLLTLQSKPDKPAAK